MTYNVVDYRGGDDDCRGVISDYHPAALAKINVPVLLLSGQNSYPFLNLTDEQLNRLIPNSERIVLNGAGHQMFYDRPELCDAESLSFFERN